MNPHHLGPHMSDSLTLGVDIGTSATKVLLLKSDSTWEMGTWPTSEGLWNQLRNWLGERGNSVSRVGITAHGPSAVVIRDGELCGRIIPWHETLPEQCQSPPQGEQRLPETRAWVPARLAQWESENGPIGMGVAVQIKDFHNWELTGVIARDRRSMRGFGGDGYFRLPQSVIGRVTEEGSKKSGIAEGAEVICGCDDLTAGVIGLNVKPGILFNLANTSEHVGEINDDYQEGMSWLPSLGELPPLSYNATTFGANANTIERNEAILELRNQFPPHEMWIGGGFALDSQLVEERNAVYKAGQEVSVLGVAKLACRKPLAVIFGAGKVGRGFLAQLLNRANWDFSLVDSHAETIEQLQDSEGWDIYNLANGDTERLQAKELIHSDEDLSRLLAESDLVLTSMGANHLISWAEMIREPLCKRLEDGYLDIILAENHPRPATAVREALLNGANAKNVKLISENLGIAQAQVLRSCIEPTEHQHPLSIQVQDHWTLPLDGDALRTPIYIEGFELKSNFERELTRKLFTYNCVNAMVCYIGHAAGYEWLADAANDPKIAEIALQAGRESSAALVAAYGFDAEEQRLWCNRALEKYQDKTIRDPIERNARDPVRKLGRYERLLGPIHLCIDQNLPHQTLLVGVAAALRYPGAKMAGTLPTGEAEARLESLFASESI
tara:strand:+ start:774 stop:2780 length:2007 start_codon:yes stop_codon:yes gene_type:complete